MKMKADGASESEIEASFKKPAEMEIFSYKGPIDTVMTPMDSIRYHKFFLRCGFMSMDPKTGQVKAYIGGPDFEHFQYDMVNDGRRQVGSTVKPFLYTLAMGTYDMICRYPKTFAAAIPICGGVYTDRLKSVKKLPIRIYYGSADPVVSPQHSKNAYKTLKTFGSHNVEIFEYPGVGHASGKRNFLFSILV